MRKATFSQYLQIGKLIEDGALDRDFVQAIIEGRVGIRNEMVGEPNGAHPYRSAPSNGDQTPPSNYCLVPDMSASELVAKVEQEFEAKGLRLKYLDEVYRSWDFTQYRVAEGQEARFIEVHGERYEVLTWKPGVYKTTQEVRAHFEGLKADGNTAAFLAWVMETKPMGYHISIPSDDALLWRLPKSGCLCAPCFCRDGGCRVLRLYGVRDGWDDDWVFVAFRKVPR